MGVIIWKNTGSPAYAGKRINFFRVRWDEDRQEFVADPKGPWWGIEDPNDGQTRRLLLQEPEMYGTVIDRSVIRGLALTVKSPEMGLNVPRLDLGTPTLGEIPREREESEGDTD